jgi:hypothetical protein
LRTGSEPERMAAILRFIVCQAITQEFVSFDSLEVTPIPHLWVAVFEEQKQVVLLREGWQGSRKGLASCGGLCSGLWLMWSSAQA